ncbi:tigger transposable element-derived protein 4-like [Sipha flava]|uniref:Tigger transposable element-derived protein 4-like n=1 Tax=Sipha flava TaxID=143950 RepID=A0A8B8GPV8_9HEMI|nr:tigger transposable element-derived protein 4-like [Sipha flava]
MSASNSEKYKSLTISEKKQLIEALERGNKKTEVAKTFDIPLSTLSTILKDKNKIITASSSGGRKRNSKDETALFFKCLPDKTFTFKEEKCHGGKHSKDRLTILLAVNMDGSEKLTPLLIGKAAKPRCFNGIRSFPITYCSNKKAWMTTELFNEWLFSLNEDMKKQE